VAVLTAANAVTVYQEGRADKVGLIALRNVTTGDTLDIGPSLLNVLVVVNRAVVIGILGGAQIAASFAGTVVTMPSGMTNDTGYLTVWGSAGS
jgi:hypothetical protein